MGGRWWMLVEVDQGRVLVVLSGGFVEVGLIRP